MPTIAPPTPFADPTLVPQPETAMDNTLSKIPIAPLPSDLSSSSPVPPPLSLDSDEPAAPSVVASKKLSEEIQTANEERSQFRKALDEVRGLCNNNGMVQYAKVFVPQVAVACATANVAENALKAYEAPEGESMKHVRNAAVSALSGVPGNPYAIAASGAIESMALKDSDDKSLNEIGDKGMKKAGIKAVSAAVAGKYGPLLESVTTAAESVRTEDRHANTAIRDAVIAGFGAVVTKSNISEQAREMVSGGVEFAANKVLPEFKVVKTKDPVNDMLGIGVPDAMKMPAVPNDVLTDSKDFSMPSLPDDDRNEVKGFSMPPVPDDGLKDVKGFSMPPIPEDSPAMQKTNAMPAIPEASTKPQFSMPVISEDASPANASEAAPEKKPPMLEQAAAQISIQEKAEIAQAGSALSSRMEGLSSMFNPHTSEAPKPKALGPAAPSPFSNQMSPYR